jgi:hypothetical protein
MAGLDLVESEEDARRSGPEQRGCAGEQLELVGDPEAPLIRRRPERRRGSVFGAPHLIERERYRPHRPVEEGIGDPMASRLAGKEPTEDWVVA